MLNGKKKSGFGLLEIVLAVSIIAGSLFAISGAGRLAFIISEGSLSKSQADFLLEEGVEALKTIRDSSWSVFSAIPAATNYYLVFSGNAWQATSTNPGPISNIFTRTFQLQNVFRDANGNIASTGALEPNTRKVIMAVSWRERNLNLSESAISYISRINN